MKTSYPVIEGVGLSIAMLAIAILTNLNASAQSEDVTAPPPRDYSLHYLDHTALTALDRHLR